MCSSLFGRPPSNTLLNLASFLLLVAKKKWKCSVCGFIHEGGRPHSCPQCGSSAQEFLEFKEKKQLTYDGKKFDVLLLNSSSHREHNTGHMVDLAEAALKKRKVSYRRFNLSEFEIKHCWCCYSNADAECTYPCRNQMDDAPALHEMLVQAKAVIVASPINWNNMSARLKDFLDRTTCLQNLGLLKKPSLTTNKTVGIFVNGHEDGAVKTAMDIFVYFQQMGFILAPFGFTYRTHGAQYPAETDNSFFRKDKKLEKEIDGVVNNVVNLMKQELEKKLKGKIVSVCE